MRRDLQDRREETFDLLVNKGVPYRKVVEQIASKYDISESGVESDINRMDDWLPKLVDETDHSRKDGKARLKELKSNRERLQQMAMEARRDNKLDRELAIRRKIEDSIELEVALRQSLGHMEREPTAAENVMADFATGAMRVEFPDEDAEDGEEPE
jgi:transposase